MKGLVVDSATMLHCPRVARRGRREKTGKNKRTWTKIRLVLHPGWAHRPPFSAGYFLAGWVRGLRARSVYNDLQALEKKEHAKALFAGSPPVDTFGGGQLDPRHDRRGCRIVVLPELEGVCPNRA